MISKIVKILNLIFIENNTHPKGLCHTLNAKDNIDIFFKRKQDFSLLF